MYVHTRMKFFCHEPNIKKEKKHLRYCSSNIEEGILCYH